MILVIANGSNPFLVTILESSYGNQIFYHLFFHLGFMSLVAHLQPWTIAWNLGWVEVIKSLAKYNNFCISWKF
jgi:hypothetical protein